MSAHRIMFVGASIGGVVTGGLTGIRHLLRRLDRRRFALTLFEVKPERAREDILGAAPLPAGAGALA